MEGPIYKLSMVRPKEAWYRMSQDQRNAYLAKIEDVRREARSKSLLICQSLWSNERWALFGVEEFPDLNSLIKQTELLFDMGHYHLINGFTILGTKWPEDDPTQTLRPTMENSVFKIWMMRPTDAWYEMTEEERNAFAARSGKILSDVGGKTVVRCACGWSNEQWVLFGVEEFPSVEAAQRHADLLVADDHFRYSEGVSMLGTLWRLE
jgi:hypothetical protein